MEIEQIRRERPRPVQRPVHRQRKQRPEQCSPDGRNTHGAAVITCGRLTSLAYAKRRAAFQQARIFAEAMAAMLSKSTS